TPKDRLAGRPLTIVGGGREALAVGRRGRLGTVCARGACPAWSSGPSTSPLGGSMGGPNAIGFVAMAVGLLGALALTVGGLLRLVRPLAQVAGRLLTCSAVGGALAVIVGLCVVTVRVGVLHGRDDVGLIG